MEEKDIDRMFNVSEVINTSAVIIRENVHFLLFINSVIPAFKIKKATQHFIPSKAYLT